MNTEHKPDIGRLPESVRQLEGKAMDPLDQSLEDGDVMLAAVPVFIDKDWNRCLAGGEKGWRYELSVVQMMVAISRLDACDEHYFGIDIDGEPWGWDISDIDFFVLIK